MPQACPVHLVGSQAHSQEAWEAQGVSQAGTGPPVCCWQKAREGGVFGLAFTFTLIRQGRLSHCLSFTQLDSSTGILTGP